MSKGALKFLAAVLTTGIAVVPFMGLDDLPRGLRAGIDSERAAFAATGRQFDAQRREVTGDLAAEPELFRIRNMNAAFPARLSQAESALQKAAVDMAALERLRKANRRQDREEAERLLAEERKLRLAAAGEAAAVEKEADHWVSLKRNLPTTLEQMDRDRQAVHGDLAGVASAVERAAADWPEKKTDLEGRLAALRAIPAEADKTWAESEPLRKKAAARDYEGLDYAALAAAADSLHGAAAGFPAKSQEVKALTGQLYDGWDKILTDLDRRGSEYREKIRTVRTRKTEVTTDEQWVSVSRAEFQGAERNLGMAIAHKPPGKYDFEAERVAQPAGFAYMASPDQGRNQYGYWDHRGGQSFWVFYGQYALLRDLLSNRSYRAPEPRDWESYRTSRERGQTYYGRDENDRPKYGTQGTSTQSGYSGSKYAQSGGFKDSKYATRPGGYAGSKYQTPAARNAPSRSWSPPSRSSPRSSPSGGRTFGGRRR